MSRRERPARPTQKLSDLDAEREVIASVCFRPELAGQITLEPGDFSVARHGDVWAAIRECIDRGLDPGIAEIRDVMRDRGTYEKHGGVRAIGEAIDRQGATLSALHFASKVRRLAVLRTMERDQGELMQALAQHDEGAIGEVLTRMDLARRELTASETTSHDVWVDEVDSAVSEAIAPRRMVTFPLGLRELDEHMGGAEPGWLIVVMGAAKSGKTALALGNVVRANAMLEHRVLVVSLEMSSRDCIRRLLAGESRVPVRAQRNSDLSAQQQSEIISAGDVVSRWDIDIVTSVRSVDDIAATARKANAERKVHVLVVDYIQLVDNGLENAQLDVAKTTRGLKLLAQELGCVVVALSQPNNTDARSGDLGLFSGKGSGSIAADCDAMLVPLRDNDAPRRAGIALVGFRHGEPRRWDLGSLEFDGARMMFVEPGLVWQPHTLGAKFASRGEADA